MGFHVNVNSILRSDTAYDLAVGATFPFNKSGSRIFFDTIPVWLTDSQWNVLAEISIVSQTRSNNQLRGEFRVDYIYSGAEQATVSKMFVRMYDGLMDDFIYMLSSQAEYDAAQAQGTLVRPSIDTEGFLHASPRSQLERVANKYYRQTEQPLVMIVDKKRVAPPVEWEPATGGLYPHIYGPLNMNAVASTVPIALGSDDRFAIELAY